ncbi:hypothetical protein ES332_A04G139400v1 [Gossypium tomentosum]|nr:hypothetical protein ES332_A04G139400v1 [Gossypium tomentosum]
MTDAVKSPFRLQSQQSERLTSGSSGVFLCKLDRTEERGNVRRRLCEEPLMGAQLSGIFQKLLVLSAAELLFGFRIWARFRIWVYEFGLKLYLGWYKFFIWA